MKGNIPDDDIISLDESFQEKTKKTPLRLNDNQRKSHLFSF